jgi:hypothetical protein
MQIAFEQTKHTLNRLGEPSSQPTLLTFDPISSIMCAITDTENVMIYIKGNFKPLKSQIQEAVTRGDNSFCNVVQPVFMEHTPKFLDMIPADPAIVLGMRNVEPHQDEYLGQFEGIPETCDRRAIFWLLRGKLHIQVANDYKRMEAGDFIVFNDAMTHSVIATTKWFGAAWQLQPR